MNIEQAKRISVVEILERMNVQPVKVRHNDYWYLSPLREEKTASFKVNAARNVWYDFGEGQGGDVVGLVQAHLKNTKEGHTVHDALRWLENMTGSIPFRKPAHVFTQLMEGGLFVIKDSTGIKHRLLIRYLQSRGISLSLAGNYFKQLRIYNRQTKKSFYALGFQNEEEGYEARNPHFKSCLGTKTITFIRGGDPKDKGIHIFEGSFDFLSVLETQGKRQFDDDTIVLNSTSCIGLAIPYIKNYGYRIAYTWMDNDKAGHKARQSLADFFSTEQELRHRPMNRLYSTHKDVNAWHLHQLQLSL